VLFTQGRFIGLTTTTVKKFLSTFQWRMGAFVLSAIWIWSSTKKKLAKTGPRARNCPPFRKFCGDILCSFLLTLGSALVCQDLVGALKDTDGRKRKVISSEHFCCFHDVL